MTNNKKGGTIVKKYDFHIVNDISYFYGILLRSGQAEGNFVIDGLNHELVLDGWCEVLIHGEWKTVDLNEIGIVRYGEHFIKSALPPEQQIPLFYGKQARLPCDPTNPKLKNI